MYATFMQWIPLVCLVAVVIIARHKPNCCRSCGDTFAPAGSGRWQAERFGKSARCNHCETSEG